jgi:hypothetical protein
MSIRLKHVVAAVALIGTTTLVTTQVASHPRQDAAAATAAEMMAAWAALAQPGPEHARMAKWAGTWDQQNTHWMFPGAEPTRSKGVARLEPIMDGRFMLEHVDGTFEMHGQEFPFHGLGIFGYDNFTKKHVYTWVDNHGTMIMTAEGTADPSGSVITYHSTVPDPTTGGSIDVKSVTRVLSEDEHVFEMYTKQGDVWFQNMEIVQTRR